MRGFNKKLNRVSKYIYIALIIKILIYKILLTVISFLEI